MSCVCVVTPLVIAGWPAISAAVTAAMGTMGFTLAKGSSGRRLRLQSDNKTRTEIEVPQSEVLEGAGGSSEELVVEKDGIRAIFSRDPRGALRVCMEGEGFSKPELQKIGEELIGRVTQQYVYHRLMTEMKNRNMIVMDEEVGADNAVRIRVRNR
jgi:hypothetical protein